MDYCVSGRLTQTYLKRLACVWSIWKIYGRQQSNQHVIKSTYHIIRGFCQLLV